MTTQRTRHALVRPTHVEPLLRTRQLTKDYGAFRALDDLNLAVAPGEVFGLLGPNGSGKTTALRLMLGFLRPTPAAPPGSPATTAGTTASPPAGTSPTCPANCGSTRT